MTLVIAARCNEGIAFAYDKLIYEGGRPFPSVLEHKVCALGNLAIGVSGCILKPEDHVLEISKQYGGLFQNSNASSLMHGLVRSRSSNRFQELGFEGINMFPESYLFGFIEGGTPQLFFFDDRTSAEPQEVNFGAIGFGVYPEVVEYLESSPNPQKSIDDTMDCLNEAMQSAFRINQGQSSELLLGGLGFAVVTSNGVKPYQRRLSEGEMRVLLQHANLRYTKQETLINYSNRNTK